MTAQRFSCYPTLKALPLEAKESCLITVTTSNPHYMICRDLKWFHAASLRLMRSFDHAIIIRTFIELNHLDQKTTAIF